MTDRAMIKDIHRQFTRTMVDQLTTPEMQTSNPAIASAAQLLDRALNQVTRTPHLMVRQQDEIFCSECGVRWDVGEPEPATSCTTETERRIATVQNQIKMIENSGRPGGRDRKEYTALGNELHELQRGKK